VVLSGITVVDTELPLLWQYVLSQEPAAEPGARYVVGLEAPA